MPRKYKQPRIWVWRGKIRKQLDRRRRKGEVFPKAKPKPGGLAL